MARTFHNFFACGAAARYKRSYPPRLAHALLNSLRRSLKGSLCSVMAVDLPTSGQPVTGFSVATDESFTGKDGNRQERVEWHNIVVFGKPAETCAKYLGRGRQIYVEGRLQTREFESKNGGGKRQRAEIVAQRVQFLGPALMRPAVAKPRNLSQVKRFHSEWFESCSVS